MSSSLAGEKLSGELLRCLLSWQVSSSVVAVGACLEPLRCLLSWQVSSSVVAAVLDLANLPSSVSAILPLNVPNCRVFSSFDYTYMTFAMEKVPGIV